MRFIPYVGPRQIESGLSRSALPCRIPDPAGGFFHVSPFHASVHWHNRFLFLKAGPLKTDPIPYFFVRSGRSAPYYSIHPAVRLCRGWVTRPDAASSALPGQLQWRPIGNLCIEWLEWSDRSKLDSSLRQKRIQHQPRPATFLRPCPPRQDVFLRFTLHVLFPRFTLSRSNAFSASTTS